MDSTRIPAAVAAITGLPESHCRQVLRAAREAAWLSSGRHPTIEPVHISRLLLGLASRRIADVAPTIAALRDMPLQATAGPSGTLEEALVALIVALPKSPVLGDLDISGGCLSIDPERRAVTWHVHDLLGRPAALRYAAEPVPAPGIATSITIPFTAITALSHELVSHEKASHP